MAELVTKTRAAARDYVAIQRGGLQPYSTAEFERLLLQATHGEVAWFPRLPLRWVVSRFALAEKPS